MKSRPSQSPQLLRLRAHAACMRQAPTASERALWQRLKGRQLGAQFRRQVQWGSFILQGGRILIGLIFGQSSLQELEEVGVAPGGELALGLDAFLVRALVLGKVHRDFAEQRDVFGPVVGSNA